MAQRVSGYERVADDRYETPNAVTMTIVPYLQTRNATIARDTPLLDLAGSAAQFREEASPAHSRPRMVRICEKVIVGQHNNVPPFPLCMMQELLTHFFGPHRWKAGALLPPLTRHRAQT
jgi:hypothetical protein